VVGFLAVVVALLVAFAVLALAVLVGRIIARKVLFPTSNAKAIRGGRVSQHRHRR
jgi:nitrogen fixation/metabolism regulation signal transduction histidine kinase